MPSPGPADDGRSDRNSFYLVAVCFFLSGFSALLYETVWLRQFAILLGTTEQSLAIVLSSYMGGLSIGAVVAAKYADRIRRPLLVYGLLELGIAVAALMIPIGLAFVERMQSFLFGDSPEVPSAGGWAQAAFTFGSTMTLIAIPTSLMGATLPLLASHSVNSDDELGPRIGSLYSINTFGAVLGTLVAAFFCLPTFGLSRTTWIGASGNVLVFLVIVLLVRKGRVPDTSASANTIGEEAGNGFEKTSNRSEVKATSDRNHWILLLIGISGAISFCFEIVFTRMMGHYLGGSVYSFATMLSGFLLGIAIGGAIAARFALSREVAIKGFVIAQSLTAGFALLAFHVLDRMIDTLMTGGASGSGMFVSVTLSVCILLPMATSIGATFPFAIRVFARDQHEAATGSGLVYGVNVFGGIIGALLTGVLLMPWLQYHGTVLAAVTLNVALSVSTMLLFDARKIHYAWPVAALVIVALLFPRLPDNVLRATPLGPVKVRGTMLYNHVGKSATVSVFYDEGSLEFVTNGLPEARISPLDYGGDSRHAAAWLSGLPVLVHPQCESMLIIGLGGGVTAENVPPSVKEVDVIELEPAVIEANRRVATMRSHDPLSDPRIKIILNDGRNALSRTRKKFDAIVSQPSHPWTAGASHLYTREFALTVSDRLNPGGVFLQWMASEFVDPDLTASMAATLTDVFPNVRLYSPFVGSLLFVCSDKVMDAERRPSRNDDQDSSLCEMSELDRNFFRKRGIVTRTHLLSMLLLDEQGVNEIAEGAPLILDERNLLAMKSPRLLGQPRNSDVEVFLVQHSPVNRGLDSLRELCPTFDLTALTKKLKNSGYHETLHDDVIGLEQSDSDRAIHEIMMSSLGLQESVSQLRQLYAQFPDDGRLCYQMLRYSLLGLMEPQSEESAERLKSNLSEDQALVIQCVEATIANDMEFLREQDSRLALMTVETIEHEGALMSRLPWRLEVLPNERQAQGAELLEIIDQNSPYMRDSILVWFRVEAAIRANRPYAALSTAGVAARQIEEAMIKKEQSVNLGNLMRIQRSISDPGPFASVPSWRYREVVNLVGDVLRRATQGEY